MFRNKAFWIVLLALVIVAAGACYYYYSNVYLQAQQPVEGETIATYTVGRGDLVITASGSGTLIPAAETALGFRSSGVLAEMLVAVGDKIEVGELVARLDDADALDQVAQAEINLRQAEVDLEALAQEVDPADLAAAQASILSAKAEIARLTAPPGEQELLAAQESLKSAKVALQDLLAGPDPDEVEIAMADLTLAEINLRTAQAAYDKIAYRDNVGATQEAADLWQATTSHDQAKAVVEEAREGATADEIADARAQVALAQADLDGLREATDPDELAAAEAQLEQAQAQLDSLVSGASAKDLETAELNLTQKELDLASAQRAVAETQLVSPASGTVIAVEAGAGESVGTESILTLADLEEPQLQFWVEEADLASVALGNRVSIVFEALPDHTFPGEITGIDPMLVDVDGTPAVQAYASVDLTAHPIGLLSGMNAEVEVVAGESLGAVLVPLQALRELGTDQHAVFVVLPNDELEMRVVQVGLKDFVNAEILYGVEAGEVISLGTVGGSDTSDEVPANDEGPGPGMMRFLGG